MKGILNLTPREAALFCLFCLLILPARANLGETIQQCVARYGTPVGYSEASDKNPFGTVTFAAGGYALTIFVINNKEVGARVFKLDKSAFADQELQTLMAADSGSSPWKPTPSDDPTCLQWSRDDHATVLYDKAKHMVIFTSVEMVQALHFPAPKPNTGH